MASLERPDHGVGERRNQCVHGEVEVVGSNVEVQMNVVAYDLGADDIDAQRRVQQRFELDPDIVLGSAEERYRQLDARRREGDDVVA